MERLMITALLTFRSHKQKWPREYVYQSIVTSLLVDLMLGYSIVLNSQTFLRNFINMDVKLNVIALLPVAGF